MVLSSGLPFLVGGTFAVRHYTGIERPTKDIDIFCKASDYPRILKIFTDKGYKVMIWDERWLAKIYGPDRRKHTADLIFGSIPGTWPITDSWFKWSQPAEILGKKVRVPSVIDMIVSKLYRMDRVKFDGADVVHLVLKQGKNLDWKQLMDAVEPNWELLLIHLLLFRFVYPSERKIIPKATMEELLDRVGGQFGTNQPQNKITRGSLLSTHDFRIAIEKWGYKDITH